MRRILFLLLIFGFAAYGDSGTLLLRNTAGPFEVTVFSKEDALRTGPNEFSVLVNNVMDAKVLLHLIKSDSAGVTRVTGIATHAKATNKMMYGTTMNLPSAGIWKMEVDVSAAGQTGTASQNIVVSPPLPPAATYWPYIAMVPFAGMAFLLNRWLKKKMGVGRRLR